MTHFDLSFFSEEVEEGRIRMDSKMLFQPFRLRRTELKNRLVMFAAGTSYARKDGYLTDRQSDYYARRAEGGVGLIIVEGAYVDPAGKINPHGLGLYEDKQIHGFKKLVKRVHEYGGKIAIQAIHGGRETSPEITGFPSVAPSELGDSRKRLADFCLAEKPQALTTEEIKNLIVKFGEFAKRARESEFDGIELLCGHRTLTEQFLFSDSNQRQDEYGGCIENRARFVCDIVQKFREIVGSDLFISCRVPVNEYHEGGYTNTEIKIVLRMLEEAGADIINPTVVITSQWVNLLPMAFPRGALSVFGEKVRRCTHLPILFGVRVNDPQLAENLLREKRADLIGMARPLICDPDLPNKTQEGRFEDIRMCIACNKGCAERVYIHKPITCTLNVEVGRENELMIKLAQRPKKILIIGAGPAGMEAARVAALRGHHVYLYERTSELGGQLKIAIKPPHKEEIMTIISYYETQLKKLGVKTQLGIEVDEKLVQEMRPDFVIVAAGGEPRLPDIPGVEASNVFFANDVLLRKREVGLKVVIVGGGLVGVETAEFLADKGKEVIVVEMLNRIASDIEVISRMFLMQRLHQKGVKTLTGTTVKEIHWNGVMVQDDRKSYFISSDAVLIAVGSEPNDALLRSLKSRIPLEAIGDCVKCRTILDAVHEGSLIARQV